MAKPKVEHDRPDCNETVKEILELEEKDLQINRDAAEACPVNVIHVYDKTGKKVI